MMIRKSLSGQFNKRRSVFRDNLVNGQIRSTAVGIIIIDSIHLFYMEQGFLGAT